ncbi:ECF transporter S component [Salinibacterium sp. ZJ77]|uniref:ECF transporter S component n=1 Tax=Salinibacterium sp. ZJ77 TaxID=2708337 RepID=UPI001FBA235E|nr:ECF transporter S component [Salinibacterium sp. ZJ77]
MTTASTDTPATASAAPASKRWRVVDIVVAAVLGVAVGLIFILWNASTDPLRELIGAAIPGASAIVAGVWLIPGVLGALVVRKPGAALFTSLVAGSVSALVVNQWGWWTLESSLLQGLGAELVFALFLYRRFGIVVAALAGIGSGIALAVNDLLLWYASVATPTFSTIYVVAAIISGALLAGVLSWLLVRALAATGVLNRFAAGRERTELV